MEFKIAGPKRIPKGPKNVFRLKVSAMSGDADHYETNVWDVEPERKKAIELAIGLCDWANKDWPNRDSILDRINEIQKDHKVNLYSLVGRDTTCYDYICRPSLKELTWFDENGVEHLVNIKR